MSEFRFPALVRAWGVWRGFAPSLERSITVYERSEMEEWVRMIAKVRWMDFRVRDWAYAHGMHSLKAYTEDCLRVAEQAVEDGVPWVDALDM